MRILLASLALSAALVSPALAFEISSPSVSDGKWDNKYIATRPPAATARTCLLPSIGKTRRRAPGASC